MASLDRRAYTWLIMTRPLVRITTKEIMERYQVGRSTAIRWRKNLREIGVLFSTSPSARSVVGCWAEIDRALQLGQVGQQSRASSS